MTDPAPTGLHCPLCAAPVLAAPMRTASTGGEPDVTGYQCGGGDSTPPCEWFVVWPGGNPPMTDDFLAAGVR